MVMNKAIKIPDLMELMDLEGVPEKITKVNNSNTDMTISDS